MSDYSEAEGNRWLSRVTIQPRQSRKRLHEEILAGFGAPRTGFAVAGDLGVDQARIERGDGFVAEASLLDDAGTKVLDEYVSASEECAHLLEVGGVFEVGGKGLLIPINGMEEGGVAIEREVRDVELAAEITLTGTLDLDDAGAEIGEAQRGRGTGEELREVDDEQTLKWFHLWCWMSARLKSASTSHFGDAGLAEIVVDDGAEAAS